MAARLLARLRIGPKLLLAPALVLVLLIVSSCGAYWAMVRQNQSLDSIARVHTDRIRHVGELVTEAQRAHAGAYQLLTWISASVSSARVAKLAEDIHRRHADLDERFVRLSSGAGQDQIARRLLARAQAAHQAYVAGVLEVIELTGGDQSLAAIAMVKAEQAFAREAVALAALAAHEQQLSAAAARRAAADFAIIRLLMPVLVAVSILLSLFVTMAVRRSLLDEVGGIGQCARDLASGNLAVPLRHYGSDEISDTSRTLDASIRTLNGTLREILDSARSIDSASRDIALGNADLVSRAGSQASSIGHTSAAMEQMSAAVSQTAGHALSAARLVADAAHVAQAGEDGIERLVQTMAAIREGSQQVVDLVGVMDELAARTGTLALNAAVEVARTGGQGSGIAPIADEMRVLAQQSARAARQVRELVGQSMAQLDGGRAAAVQAGDSMAGLASSVREVGDMVSKIGEASAGQASDISYVNCAIVQMDQMTQQNSAQVAEAAAAAASLQAQANMLSRAVAAFKLDESAAPVAGKPRLWLAAKRE